MEYLKLFLLAVILNICEGYRILAVFPLSSKSHGILGDNFVKHLLDAGHEVTYITPFMKRDPHPRLRLVDASDNLKAFNDQSINVKLIMDKVVNFQDEIFLINLMIDLATHSLEIPAVQKFFRDPREKFDVVIGEWMFSDLYSAIGAIFDSPFIWVSTIEPHWMVLNLVDEMPNPAFSSDFLNSQVPPMSFMERSTELYNQFRSLVRKNTMWYDKDEATYQRLIAPIFKEQGRPVPNFNDIRYNASMILGNSQVAIGDGISLPQCYKHIGGYHIEDPVKPLPKDLQTLLDNAKHGVIYFSMGSNLRSKDMPMELKKGLLDLFGGLKETVIWKFEEILPDVPKNVHIIQWAPQQSLLAHKNLKLFITHGGLLSITETVHFGVPVISIPVFADQFLNALRLEKKGYGKKVDLSYELHKDLKIALNEVLDNPKYTQKAKELSVALHDRLNSPADELKHWVSHVARTQGAPHLRSPARDLMIYQRLYLDLLLVVLAAVATLAVVLKFVIKMVRGDKKKQKKS